ncbi:MAG: type II methionyl aminopeptidase [Nanoarchaeota archaeon]|nr:type II methionyl aminopeptidase [Nanoarchaeota archaeon]MBU1135784.1 type II methionyl aminopeptidase [Nanoarchaeota archaeon]MBU2519652.1 type II methionyl aminopeptidase [Nanoarchaeota archaeon]
MEENILEKYKKAGSITATIREDLLKKIKPGMKILEIAEYVDAEIEKRGGKPAFPVNISINEITAHDTPRANDDREVKEGDLVKIDIGVHVDGYIGDMAFTYCSKPSPLIKANQEVLEEAIKILKPGITVAEIGKTIQDAAEKRGFGLITNLTGHTLDKYVFHGQPSILNVDNDSDYVFKEGDVLALEPFLTESNSTVKESGIIEIYRYMQDRPVRLAEARQILAKARDEFKQLPFAKRWLYKKFSPVKVALSMRQLEEAMAVETYPVLKNRNNNPVSQAEHTIVLIKNGHVVTTR